MRIKQLFIGFSCGTLALSTALGCSLVLHGAAERSVEEAHVAQYRSYLLADELRQSSDDLTRLVRVYASTGDTQYRDQYNRILDIRNGLAPRPLDYHRVYWDFVAGGTPEPRPLGEAVALRDLMRQAGFTEEEFALLDEANKRSDGLVQLEVEAMKLVEDINERTSTASRARANVLVNSPEYHRFKAEIMQPIDAFYVALEARLQGTLDAARATSTFYQMMTVAAGGLLLVMLGAFGAVIFRRVIRSIVSLQATMGSIAGQDLETMVDGQQRADEIGDMARALEVFRKAALTQRALEEEAARQRENAEAERRHIQTEAEAAAKARLDQATGGLADALRRLAGGDLGFELSEPFHQDFEMLRHDLNTAVAQLGRVLGAVSESAQTISDGTGQISASADDLSKRTEQQAASLEETAAALEQITSNVANSAKRTEEARQVASQANISATQSGVVVANAEEAMQRIEQSSNQISSIISVIDEIAFQTNLLALNAGVEAARAGDAGKGFAVVAQEVRELAQRSANAAKEIKGLIGNSTAEVKSGVELVREAGNALKAIEHDVVTMNQHMDAISTAAREQSVGLSEINMAVNQMDHVTQKNAAMVEEANAASATLAAEAHKLRELIRHFSFRQDSAEQQQPAPATQRMRQYFPRAVSARVAGATALAGKADGWEEF
ncbi:methyl-accepting chemotaxis protein [Shinella granuli]|uniref:Methyl-accepting chemotaxis protein n=1 Tax=Shinella granuli TaxID=323621 RepID=A0A4R2CAI5_SHIGR|nr:methyl-accepting chemotaxis protein [Shinella granuli]TCN37133.1 methyl-accepting chemotaxis protein [Shinella granuli]